MSFRSIIRLTVVPYPLCLPYILSRCGSLWYMHALQMAFCTVETPRIPPNEHMNIHIYIYESDFLNTHVWSRFSVYAGTFSPQFTCSETTGSVPSCAISGWSRVYYARTYLCHYINAYVNTMHYLLAYVLSLQLSDVRFERVGGSASAHQ